MTDVRHLANAVSAVVPAALVALSGCARLIVHRPSVLAPIPANAELLFASDRGRADRNRDIYALDAQGNVTRITDSDYSHFIFGVDRTHRYLVVSRMEQDTNSPAGLGDEDRRAVWILDLQTGTEARITDPKNNAEARSFSPDGGWVVMCMAVAGEEQRDLYKARRDGSELIKLTDTKRAIECDPAFSNDGKRIAFTYLDEQTPRFVIKTMDSNGGDVRFVYDAGDGPKVGPFPPGAYDPAWSPDDAWLAVERAFTQKGNFGSGTWHVLKVRADGSEAIDLTAAGGHTDLAEYLPSFSPEGKRIVFGAMYEAPDASHSYVDILTVDAQTGASLERRTTDPKSDMYPVWLP